MHCRIYRVRADSRFSEPGGFYFPWAPAGSRSEGGLVHRVERPLLQVHRVGACVFDLLIYNLIYLSASPGAFINFRSE